jgi:hypothetical protein
MLCWRKVKVSPILPSRSLILHSHSLTDPLSLYFDWSVSVVGIAGKLPELSQSSSSSTFLRSTTLNLVGRQQSRETVHFHASHFFANFCLK